MPTVSFIVISDPDPAPLTRGCLLNIREIIWGLAYNSFTVGTILMDNRHHTTHEVIRFKDKLQLKPPLLPITKCQEISAMTKLKSILCEMLEFAETHPDESIKRCLSKGLRIDLMSHDKETYLQISRTNGVGPSPEEWLTVCKLFPYPILVTPTRISHAGRIYLRATFPTQPKLF